MRSIGRLCTQTTVELELEIEFNATETMGGDVREYDSAVVRYNGKSVPLSFFTAVDQQVILNAVQDCLNNFEEEEPFDDD